MPISSLIDQHKDRFKLILDNSILFNDFQLICEFLDEHPELQSKAVLRNKSDVSALLKISEKFKNSRNNLSFNIETPSTKNDPVVATIFKCCKPKSNEIIDEVLDSHKLLMAVENKVGETLERFLHSVLKDNDWIWCSGSLVQAVDFIKKSESSHKWVALQIKNRDNSENSSSSKIRDGTQIYKWFRFYSRSGKTNWEEFPDDKMKNLLNEENFQNFVKKIRKIINLTHIMTSQNSLTMLCGQCFCI